MAAQPGTTRAKLGPTLRGWMIRPKSLDHVKHVEHIPSGKLTVCELENGPVEIVDLPIKNSDFP